METQDTPRAVRLGFGGGPTCGKGQCVPGWCEEAFHSQQIKQENLFFCKHPTNGDEDYPFCNPRIDAGKYELAGCGAKHKITAYQHGAKPNAVVSGCIPNCNTHVEHHRNGRDRLPS